MNFIRTKALYQKACQESSDLHIITDDERRRLQKHLLMMYKEIEKVCVNNNLTVMLAYGSVLGAVRHGGFIPWDDDIDLFMPRKDYDLFINNYSDALPNYLKVYAPNMKNKSISRFAKVVDIRTKFIEAEADDIDDQSQGIFVDIFPLDSIKLTPMKNKVNKFISMVLIYVGSSVRQYELNSIGYKKLMSTSTSAKLNYWIRHILGCCFSFFNYQRWYNILDWFCENDLNTGFFADNIGEYKWEPIAEDVFLPPQKCIFEDISVFLPNDPIVHLEKTYANWQELPPIEERYQHYIRKIGFI